jgi:hypothetical protein
MIRHLPLLLVLAFAPNLYAQGAAEAPKAPTPEQLQQMQERLAVISDVNELLGLVQRMAGDHLAEARIGVWKRIAELRPHVAGYRYELAANYALLDRKTESYNLLLNLFKQGHSMRPDDDPRFAKVATTPVWNYIVEGMQSNLSPFGEAELAWRLPAEDLLVESLAWDATRGKLLVGGAREGAVYVVESDGKLKPLVKADAENGLWAVFDLAVDAERGILWVASTAVPHFKAYDPTRHLGRAGVFEFDLKTGKLRKQYLSPVVMGASFFISSLALGPKGEVYAADGVNNAVYTVSEGALKRVFHAPGLTSIRGMTVSGDGRLLYTADHEMGIYGYDLVAGQPFELRAPPTVNLGGLEGLVWWKGQLLAVQNGVSPKRVVRLALGPDGRSIAAEQLLDVANPAFKLPTAVTVGGDAAYLIANSQKPRYDRFGLLRNAAELEGVAIYRVDAGFSKARPDFVPSSAKQLN